MAGETYPTTVPTAEILSPRERIAREYTVKLYDFRRPDKFSLEQIHTIRALHETLARRTAPILSRVTGGPMEVHCRAVDQLAYHEFLESAPSPSAFILMTMSPLKGTMLIQIDGGLAHHLVRTACRSAAAWGRTEPSQELTEIERVVLQDVVERVIPAIDEAWRPVLELSCSVTHIATDPQMVQIVPPTEMIVLATMDVAIGGSTAAINLAIPYVTIEPIIGKFSAQHWHRTVRSPNAGTVSSRAVDLPVSVELFAVAAPVHLADLPAVASGELLALPTLSAGIAGIATGGVTVAEVAVDAEQLASLQPLRLSITAHGANPIAAAIAGSAGDESPLPVFISTAFESLDRQIKEVRRAVEEIRDDRETLLAELAEGPGGMHDQDRQPALDRRHHHHVAVLLAAEDPATIGFVLSGLAPETAAAILADLDPELQPGVVRSVVTVGGGSRDLHRKLLSFIGRLITRSLETTTNGGADVAAEILTHAPRRVEKGVMEAFMRDDKPLFEEIARRLFVFEDFVLVDPAAIKKLMGSVTADEMALAMKGAPAEVVQHIENAVDPVTLDILHHCRETLGRVRRQDVEAAQRDMIEELRRLEQAGEVVIARTDEVIE